MDHETWSEGQERAAATIDGHDVELAYRDDGEGDPVVFVHGIPTWSFLWRDVADAVSEEHRAITYDMAGYGNSSRYDGFDRSIRAQEQAFEDLLDELGLDTVTIVAHDIGGGMALRFAANNPDRVDKFVASNIVCYDSWPVEFVVNVGLPSTEEMDRGNFEGKLDFAFAEGTYGEADPEFVEGMKAPWLAEGGQRALARAGVGTNTNHTMEIAYDAIDADLLCLWAEDDVMQPIEYGEKLAADLGGEVVRLSDAYHWVVEDRTEAYTEELLEFLD